MEKKVCQVFNFTMSFGSSFGQVILVKKKKKRNAPKPV